METFAIRVMRARESRKMTVTTLSEATGVSRAVLTRGENDNVWSFDVEKKVAAALGITSEGAEITRTTKEHVVRKKRQTLADEIAAMEVAQAKGEQRPLQPRLFDALTGEGFLAVSTLTAMPALLSKGKESDELRAAVYKAQDRGAKTLFLVPDAAKMETLRRFKIRGIHKTETLIDGYNKYFGGSQSRIIASSTLDIAPLHYIISLIGEPAAGGITLRRVVERGPATRGPVWVVPLVDGEYEGNVARYLAGVLRAVGIDEFAEDLIRRMGVFEEE